MSGAESSDWLYRYELAGKPRDSRHFRTRRLALEAALEDDFRFKILSIVGPLSEEPWSPGLKAEAAAPAREG
jgi:hypothetical protein